MANTTGKKFGGRRKGTPNGERKELVAMLAEKYPDYHPVIAMADIANNEKYDIDLRFQANKECAKYVCPQLKAIELTGQNGNQLSIKVHRD